MGNLYGEFEQVNGGVVNDLYARIAELEVTIAGMELAKITNAELLKQLTAAEAKLDAIRDAVTARYHRPLHQTDNQLLLELDVLLDELPKEGE